MLEWRSCHKQQIIRPITEPTLMFSYSPSSAAKYNASILSPWVVYRRLFVFVKKYWPAFLVALFGYVLFAAAQAGFVRLLEYMVESVENSDPHAQYWVPFLVVFIVLVRGVGFFLGNYCFAYVARRVMHDMRVDIFDKLLLLPASYFHHNASGNILSKLTFNVEQITGAVTGSIKVLTREGLIIIGLFTYLLILNWQLTMIFLLVGPFIGLIVKKAAVRFRNVSTNLQNSMGDVTARASEAIKGYEVVRIFAGQENEKKRFIAASNNNRQQAMKLALTESISVPSVQFIVGIAMAGLTYLALQPQIITTLSAGEFIAFITAAGMLAKPIRSLTEINGILQQGIAAAQSIFGILDEPIEAQVAEPLPLPALGDVMFDKVSFAYQEKTVLHDIELTLPKGKSVALVGRSGSGKSTLVNLLLGFYQPNQGQITLSGQDVNRCSRLDWRQQIALVNQQVVLFNGTVSENIAYGAMAGASQNAIESAAKAAKVDEFVQHFPNGLNTEIGESGVLLSGGQRQRIALARALLKDAPILVLDEATSALDTESERHIQEALAQAVKGRSTLMIAHRLSTIERADIIVVLDQGRIVEQGDHRSLLKNQGIYAKLYAMQFAEN